MNDIRDGANAVCGMWRALMMCRPPLVLSIFYKMSQNRCYIIIFKFVNVFDGAERDALPGTDERVFRRNIYYCSLFPWSHASETAHLRPGAAISTPARLISEMYPSTHPSSQTDGELYVCSCMSVQLTEVVKQTVVGREASCCKIQSDCNIERG